MRPVVARRLGLTVAFAALCAAAVAPGALAVGKEHGRSQARGPRQVDCSTGCTFAAHPVCGSDGEWYQNECIAACSGGVLPGNVTLCDGKPLPFREMHPGPIGAESAAVNATTHVVPPHVFTQFISEGFRYLGRIRLAHEFVPRPAVPAASGEEPLPPMDKAGNWKVKAVRCTPEGDVYIGSMKIPSQISLSIESYMPPWMRSHRPDANSSLLELASSMGLPPVPAAGRANTHARGSAPAAGAAAGAPVAAGKPPANNRRERSVFSYSWSDLLALFGSGPKPAGKPAAAPSVVQGDNSEGDTAAPLPAQQLRPASLGLGLEQGLAQSEPRLQSHARLLKELVGGDDRTDCQKGFPYTAIGQIQVVDGTGLYICTGTLIAPDKVLTAGHCVWNIKKGAFYYNLNYAPGRYRDAGKVVNPWGVVPWKSVTVFDTFKKNPAALDVAVVTLSKPLGSLTGFMGVASGCGKNMALTTAGYPQDKSMGTCMAATCMQPTLDCKAATNLHTCDTKMGMSGSPLWDAKNRIRMIHVAGLEGRGENRATTLTQFLVNTISRW